MAAVSVFAHWVQPRYLWPMRLRWCHAMVAILPSLLQAQPIWHMMHGAARPSRDSVSVMGTMLGTRVAPAMLGRARTELLLTQPMAIWRGVRFGGKMQFAAMLNAERWTMPDGELVAGIWGEGFIDRRHPHTVVHEVMLAGERRMRGARVSLAAGRGVVPFGTDDPMVRPFTKYPANHHFSQVLERIQLVSAIRVTSHVALEGGVFNGDEPAGPTAQPRWRRFADSRAARLTLWPVPQLEVQGSAAFVRSPEFVTGVGFDQHKSSASARWTPMSGALRYVLVEWARTGESYRDRDIIAYGTGLAEGVAMRGRWSAAIRLERTSRPEEERLIDQFRTARPPTDFTIKGVTRWHLATGQLAASLPTAAHLHGTVFVEATRARSTPLLTPALLDPSDVIGANSAWHLSIGMRIGAGTMAARVGRYGAGAGGPGTHGVRAEHRHDRAMDHDQADKSMTSSGAGR